MASRSGGSSSNLIQALFNSGAMGNMPDELLIERFLSGGVEDAQGAFVVLVRRHGPAVHRVCSLILKDQHETEDAFQATFLVFARRAASIRHRDLLLTWLLGVARRVAVRLKVGSHKRRTLHERLSRFKHGWYQTEEGRKDEVAELHEEIRRLPAKYQMPVLFCYMEGMSYEDAARALGVSESAIRGRLAQARGRLRSRLLRRGFGLNGAFPAIFSSYKASGGVRTALIDSTIRGLMPLTAGRVDVAGSLTSFVTVLGEGVITAMRFSEIKIVVVVTLAIGLASAGAGALVLAGGQAVVKVPEAGQLTKPPIPSELDKLQGNWIMISTQSGGICRLLPEDQRGKLSIRGSVFTFNGPPGSPETAKIEPAQTPKSIDLTPTGNNAGPLKDRAYFGIYAVEDDTLMLCLDIYHQSVRPKEFTTKPGSRDLIDIYKRVGR